MAEELAKVRDIEDLNQPPADPSLPFRVGRGLRKAAKAAVPVATSVLDVTTLPPRALGAGAMELFKGVTGGESQPFKRAPITEAASRLLQPSPVEVEQAVGGLRGPTPPTPPTPPITPSPITGAPPSPITGAPPSPITGAPPSPITGAPPPPTDVADLATETATPTVGGLRRGGPSTTSGKPFIQLEKPVLSIRSFRDEKNPAAAMAAHNAAVADYNLALISKFKEERGAELSPEELSKINQIEAQTAEAALEGESRRGLRAAQTAEATRSAEAAKLIRTNIEVPTGQFNELNEPIMTKRQVIYNPDTGQFADPLAAAQPPSPAERLRAEYAELSENKRSVLEKHFSDRTDVSPEEVMTFIKTLGE